MTTVCACEKTVVMLKHPGHLTSMKKDRGDCTSCLSLCFCSSAAGEGLRRSGESVYGSARGSEEDIPTARTMAA